TAHLIKECDEMDLLKGLFQEFTNRVDLSRDNGGTRAIAKFLEDLSESSAQEFLDAIDYLLPQLDGEAYTMRNAVLTIIGKIVVKCLKDKSGDPEMREKREQL